MNAAAAARGLTNAAIVDIEAVSADGIERVVRGFRIVIHDIPRGTIGAYFPEANPLVPLDHHDLKAHTPAYKAVPVLVTKG